MGFAEYLNQVRLNFAVFQLLHTDLSIVRIVTPKMVVKRLTAENGRISFDITMEPNEITYLHLSHQFTE